MSLSRIRLLIWKEFLQLKRDHLLLPIIFVMPVLQLIMFGYVVGADVKNLPTAIVDYDHTAASESLSRALSSTGYFIVRAHPASEHALVDLMDSSRVQVALILPKGFSAGLEQGKQMRVEVVVDGSDSKTASVAGGYAAQAISEWNRRRVAAMGLTMQGPGIDARVRVLYNPTLRAVNVMIPGLIATILLLSMSAVMSQAVVKERERGTLEQMFVTPITRGEYLVGKVTPYSLIATIQVIVVTLVGRFWFRVPFYGNIAVVGVGLLLFLFTAIGQGLIVSMLSRTRQQAQQATMFILIPTIVLSGFIFPIESMPPAVVWLTYFIPLRYAIVVLRSSFMKGSGFDTLWPQMLEMAAFSMLVFGIAIARFSKRLAE
jgi:ABC-2 type transport system permease protein